MDLISYIVLVVPALILSLYAQHKVKSTFTKFQSVLSAKGVTGAEAAKMLLRTAGITDVPVERVAGDLTDHYSPGEKVLRLSDSVYNNTSIAAIGVAAHEVGHAIQHNEGYAALNFRNAFAPIASFGSQVSMPLVMAGFFFGTFFIQIGIVLFTAVVIFQLVTLPVEFNASSRALAMCESTGMLAYNESDDAKKVLDAAALTYVAAAAVSLGTLIRLLLILSSSRDE